jgi:Domain of unknown function (DUF4340)
MKRSTSIVLVIFLALVGMMLYLNKKEPPAEATDVTPSATVEFLFSDNEGLPASIDIKSNTGEQVVMERNDAGIWVLKQPIEADADQGSAEEAASQVTSLRIESRLEVAPDATGLVDPSYELTVKMTGGTMKTVRIGDLTPTGIGYYTRIEGSDETLIVSKTGLDALIKLLESPPYVEPTATSTP